MSYTIQCHVDEYGVKVAVLYSEGVQITFRGEFSFEQARETVRRVFPHLLRGAR